MDSRIATFLLLQVMDTWHPDVIALAGRSKSKLSKTPKLQTPPIIAMLTHYPDALIMDNQPDGKVLPCGHRIDVQSILTQCNLFGDQRWGRGNHLHCEHRNCNQRYFLPVIPSPRVVSGLEGRLDLIEWICERDKHTPEQMDMDMVRTLRRILREIGYVPRNVETTSGSSWSRERRLRQTLKLFGKEGVAGATGKLNTDPSLLRGAEPYCEWRPPKKPRPGYEDRKYHAPALRRYCECEERHKRRKPRDWISTPCEDEEEPRFALQRIERERNEREGGRPGRQKRKKTVRFAAPVITRIEYYQPHSWVACERSTDPATKKDDDREIERLEADALGRWLLRRSKPSAGGQA